MFTMPEYNINLSLRLSAVLDDIGVNETMVKKRRRAWLLKEKMLNFRFQFIKDTYKMFIFGSQTEGSTTEGLNSDIDSIYYDERIQVLQNWREWEPGKKHFLMVRNEKTSPGYCLLQALSPTAKQPFPNKCFSKDSSGRVFLNHLLCLDLLNGENFRNGPAVARHFPICDVDSVYALHCSTWPKEAEPWLQQQNKSDWPTEDMRRQFEEHGCFLVAVASKTSEYQDLEFRISTCLTERHLMLSLNITQMRCYILMKMIVKTFLKPTCDQVISSYMCKNILFHCIADSSTKSTWTEHSLLTLLNQCLKALHICILAENCPHFLIPQNNILAGKLSEVIKNHLAEIMCNLIENIDKKLLEIGIDDLGKRLAQKSDGISVCLSSAYNIASQNIALVFSSLQKLIVLTLKECMSTNVITVYRHLIRRVSILSTTELGDNSLKEVASRLITPFLCSVIGSIRASNDIHHGHELSPDALIYFYRGFNSDVSSGKLKLASALYCAGHFERCEHILSAVKRQMEHSTVQSKCCCYEHGHPDSSDFKIICYEKDEDALKDNVASCVRFLPWEVNCIPHEFKYEMFRSTEQDRRERIQNDFWMDWAVVDSLPYLFFMQYKVYSTLNRPADKHIALSNLAHTINTGIYLSHRETACNLMGQCMKHEKLMKIAFDYYTNSLKLRARNNAAKWHACILFTHIFASVKYKSQ